MKVYGMWFGGNNYGPPDPLTDVEEFFSIAAARSNLIDRLHDPYYPCVSAIPPDDGGQYMYLYQDNPLEHPDPIPDRIIEFNANGIAVVHKV